MDINRIVQSYLDRLAKELDTILVQGPDLHGMMFVEFFPSLIEGPLINQPDCDRYPNIQCRMMCILHELGHVFHGHTQGRPPFQDKRFYFDNGVLKSEAQAWEFALDRWKEDWKVKFLPETRHYMSERCLGSYYRGSIAANGKPHRLMNGNRHHVEFIFDKPDDFFWSIKKRMKED